ncbi:MAG: hypothetical protein ABIY56_09125, partial [Dokdonella sp.]
MSDLAAVADADPPATIRLSELKLPLDHDAAALPALVADTLGITLGQIATLEVFKRSIDARSPQLRRVYIVDVRV